MATEKNITMKEFNGTDYDILYPKTIATQIPDVYSKTEILTTETLAKYGLTADKLPNDVFQQIKTLIDNMQNNIESRAKIQIGSYIGTGTYGASNPCSLTFNFKPIWIQLTSIGNKQSIPYQSAPSHGGNYYQNGIFLSNITSSYSNGFGIGYGKTVTGNGGYSFWGKMINTTYYWYLDVYNVTGDAAMQYNASGTKYSYLALG